MTVKEVKSLIDQYSSCILVLKHTIQEKEAGRCSDVGGKYWYMIYSKLVFFKVLVAYYEKLLYDLIIEEDRLTKLRRRFTCTYLVMPNSPIGECIA